jgi:hypothetical protein
MSNSAKSSKSTSTAEESFEFGPDLNGDLRYHRPYFMLNLPHDGLEAEHKHNGIASVDVGQGEILHGTDHLKNLPLEKRIKEWLHSLPPERKPVTDVFILSHGWHRNFFSATAAYDRLVSRLLLLRHSGPLASPRS